MAENYVSSGPIDVPFSDDDAERPEAEDEDQPGLSPAEKATRKERRTLRIKSKLDAGKQAIEDLAKERAEKQHLAERLARLEGVVSATAPKVEPADPYKARLDAVRARQEREYANLQAETKGGSIPHGTKI